MAPGAISLQAGRKALQQHSPYHVVAGLYILSDPVADQRRLRGTVYKRYKLVLVVFWKVFIFNLKKREDLVLFSEPSTANISQFRIILSLNHSVSQ